MVTFLFFVLVVAVIGVLGDDRNIGGGLFNRTVRNIYTGIPGQEILLIVFQEFHGSTTIEPSDICEFDGDVLMLRVFQFGSVKVEKIPIKNGKYCELLMNSPSQIVHPLAKGFEIHGDIAKNNTVLDLKYGGYESTVKKKVVHNDLAIIFNVTNEGLIISKLWDCNDQAAFQCEKKHLCIIQDAMCDNIKNCPSGIDEANWRCGPLGNSELVTFIIILIIGVVFCIVGVPIIIVCMRKKKAREMAEKSQSESSTLNSPGKNVGASKSAFGNLNKQPKHIMGVNRKEAVYREIEVTRILI